MDGLPIALLVIECAAINPPKPLGVAIVVAGNAVAVATLDELRRAAKKLEEFERARG